MAGLLSATVAACTSSGDDGAHGTGHPQIWTPFELRSALFANTPVAVDPTLPAGLAPADLMNMESDGTTSLKMAAAFAEGGPAAYVITDVWRGFPEIWAQPWYVLVTAWNETTPMTNRLKDAEGKSIPALVDVVPGSGFYSPFWVITYVEVPPDSDPAHYTSVKDFVDEARPMHTSSLFTYALRPDDVTLQKPKPVHPYLGTALTGLSEGTAPGVLFDGRNIGYFVLGGNNFRMDEERVVEEVPLFQFATRGSTGDPQVVPGAAAVGGVAPLLSGRPAQMTATGPRLSAYYRITWAMLPATAAVFTPEAFPELAALIAATSGDPAAPRDARIYQGRVALNAFKAATATADAAPDCFGSPTFPNSCQWLDSQARVESLLGRNALVATAVTIAAPTVPVAVASGVAK